MENNLEQLNKFLTKRASRSEILTIVFEHFTHIYDDINVDSFTKSKCIVELLDHCHKKDGLPKLARAIENKFPEFYHELDLNFDTPPKRTSKPRRTSQTKTIIAPSDTSGGVDTVSIFSSVLNFITPGAIIGSIFFGHFYTVFFRPDFWPESWVTPLMAPFHFALLGFYIFLLLPYAFWCHDYWQRINLNTAQARDFTNKKIANTWAQMIIEERKRLGRFQSVEQAKAVLTDGRSLNARGILDKSYRVGWLQFNYGKYAQMAMNFLGGELEKLWNGKSTKKRR